MSTFKKGSHIELNTFNFISTQMKYLHLLILITVTFLSIACFGDDEKGNPNSSLSKKAFEKYTSQKLSGNANNVYYQYSGFQDHIMYMRFNAENPNLLNAIIKKHKFKKKLTQKLHANGPKWWNVEIKDDLTTYSTNTHSRFKNLWCSGNIIFIQDYSI
jgi:hypothetical protein